MVEASLVGVFKTILIILGGFVILKFIGRILILKRNIHSEKNFLNARIKQKKENDFVNKNMGKINIIDPSINKRSEDIEYEDLS